MALSYYGAYTSQKAIIPLNFLTTITHRRFLESVRADADAVVVRPSKHW